MTTNTKAGGLFPNDPDGQAWSGNFPALTESSGVTIDNPGLYTNGTKDFSAQISAFKGSDILLGVPIPPDFTTFWKQAKQQGYSPKVATIGKALLFPSSVEALGDIADNLATEVWWTPTAPYTSSLTGQSAEELADAFESETGEQWTQPLGFAHALFEVAAAAVQEAGSTDADDIVGALADLDVDTVVGDVAWGKDPDVPPYVAKTPVTGGQWRPTDGGEYPFDLVVVSNTLAPTGAPSPARSSRCRDRAAGGGGRRQAVRPRRHRDRRVVPRRGGRGARASSGPTAPASRRCWTSSTAPSVPTPAASCSTVDDVTGARGRWPRPPRDRPDLPDPAALRWAHRVRERARRRDVRRGSAAVSRPTRAALDAIETAGLTHVVNTDAASLRLLDRKRLELARALATGPRLILLDEIAGGLTEAELPELVALIARLRDDGLGVMWIEHIVHALLQVVDRLMCLAMGEVVGHG